MNKFAVGTRVIVNLGEDGFRKATVVRHGRDSCGVYTEVRYDGDRESCTERVHRERLRKVA